MLISLYNTSDAGRLMKFQPKRPGTKWHRHPYGQSVRLDSSVYVPIPKSASTWCKQIWTQGRDFDFLADSNQDLHYAVILREPIDRWLAGFAQCQVGNDPSWEGHWERLGWDWVFDTMVFDNHTEPQVSFLAGLDLAQVTWFRFGPSLESDMLSWMQDAMGHYRRDIVADRYAGRDQPPRTFRNGQVGRSQSEILAMAQHALDTRPGARERVRDFYREDYDLWHSVVFYGGDHVVR